jgi:hypothetical protein
VFERRIVRKIFGPNHCKESWRIRSNNKLRKFIKAEDSLKYMEAQRIRWEHVQRMEDITPVIKITDRNPIGVRTRGRSRN